MSDETSDQPPEAEETFAMACPGCSHEFQVRSRFRGRKARCPHCGRDFQIPKVGDEALPVCRGQEDGPASYLFGTRSLRFPMLFSRN